MSLSRSTHVFRGIIGLNSRLYLPQTIRPLFGKASKETKVEDNGSKASHESSETCQDQEAPQQDAPKQMTEREKELQTKNDELIEKVKEIDDKFKRALAEGENTRIRMRKQVDDAKIFAIQGFCKDLLDVADVLETALDSVPKEELSKSEALKALFTGVEMTDSQLQSVFRRHGLVKLNPIGEKFNPNEHHALFEAVEEGKEPGTVAVVTKIGYKLHDRTVRPAMVGVVKAP